MEHVIFGGVDLSERVICLVKSRPMPSIKPKTQHVNGSDRYVGMGADILPEAIVVKLVAPPVDQRGKAELARWLGEVLYAKEPKKLMLSSDEGLWRMAVLAKTPNLREFVKSASVEVTFQPMEAWLYGGQHSVTVPSGGSATILVRGTYPTAPTIVATNANRTSSGVWGIRLDDVDFLHVQLSSASRVEIDCDKRTCLVDNAVVLPTLDSDWLQLDAGSHIIVNDQGTGACVVSWTDRWL